MAKKFCWWVLCIGYCNNLITTPMVTLRHLQTQDRNVKNEITPNKRRRLFSWFREFTPWLVRAPAYQYEKAMKVLGSNPCAVHWLLGFIAAGMLWSAFRLRAKLTLNIGPYISQSSDRDDLWFKPPFFSSKTKRFFNKFCQIYAQVISRSDIFLSRSKFTVLAFWGICFI